MPEVPYLIVPGIVAEEDMQHLGRADAVEMSTPKRFFQRSPTMFGQRLHRPRRRCAAASEPSSPAACRVASIAA